MSNWLREITIITRRIKFYCTCNHLFPSDSDKRFQETPPAIYAFSLALIKDSCWKVLWSRLLQSQNCTSFWSLYLCHQTLQQVISDCDVNCWKVTIKYLNKIKSGSRLILKNPILYVHCTLYRLPYLAIARNMKNINFIPWSKKMPNQGCNVKWKLAIHPRFSARKQYFKASSLTLIAPFHESTRRCKKDYYPAAILIDW